MLMTTTCEWRGHAVANLSEMSSLEWFTTLDRDESQPRSALTPPGAPIYFRLRTLSHSTDTVHLANQIIVGCCWLPGSASPAHRRQREQRVSPGLSKKEFSLESLQQSVAFVAGLVRRARLCWCRCCRSGPPCAALRAAVCRFGKPPLPLWARRCRVDGAAALRASAAVAVRWSWRPRCGSLPPLPPLLCAVVARCGLRATAPPFAALRGPAAGGCHVRRS